MPEERNPGEVGPIPEYRNPPSSLTLPLLIGMLVKVLPLLVKYLPLLLGLIGGLGGFLEKFKPAPGVEIDQESLAKLIEEITEREVTRIVNEHKDRVRVWVPTEEDKKRQETLDELEERLRKDQEEYEKGKKKDEFTEMLDEMKEPR